MTTIFLWNFMNGEIIYRCSILKQKLNRSFELFRELNNSMEQRPY
jgi:hypothetical protein